MFSKSFCIDSDWEYSCEVKDDRNVFQQHLWGEDMAPAGQDSIAVTEHKQTLHVLGAVLRALRVLTVANTG